MMKKLTIYLILSLLVFGGCEKDEDDDFTGDYSLKTCRVDGVDIMPYFYNDTLKFDRLFIPNWANGFDFFISRHYTQLPYVYQSKYYWNNNRSEITLKMRDWENVDSIFLNENIAILPFSQQNELDLDVKKSTKSELFFETKYLNKTYRYEFEKK